jgi:hypothetical protein
MNTAATQVRENEVTILARLFDDERGLLPRDLARTILDVEFSERDKARMHDLAVRNQADALSRKRRKSSTPSPRLARYWASSNRRPAAP